MKKLRIILYGVGAMGSNMVRLLQGRPQVLVVGAIDHDKSKICRDLGEVAGLEKNLGIEVRYPPEEVLDNIKADLVLHTTTAFMDEAFEQIMKILERRINIVTICQELFFPLGKNIAKAKEIDKKAQEMGARVTAVGINPGFIMDIVPIVCSVICWKIESIFVRRIVDFSAYGPDEMRHIGANLTPQEFYQGVKKGAIGHIGLLETTAMVAHCLGFQIDELRQTKEPLVTQKARESKFIKISPGKVCGFKQNVAGISKRKKVLDFRMVGIVSPDREEDGVEMGDYTYIYGIPNVDITIKEEISQKGGLGTAGVAANIIPKLMSSDPGFHTMNTLTLPHIWSGGSEPEAIEKITYF
jgi:hypothetical protein